MAHKFSDFSQLNKAMIRPTVAKAEAKPEPKPEPPPESQPEPAVDASIDYFSRTSITARGFAQPKGVRIESAAKDGADAAACPSDLELAARTAERDEARARVEELERLLKDEQAKGVRQEKELARLQGECGRLQGEARKRAQQGASEAASAPAPAAAARTAQATAAGLLDAPADLNEAFPGEVREMVLAALSDARDTAAQTTRERRATVLSAVLSANPPSGELERRRELLKQILRDCGHHTDPHAFAAIGFRLISGHAHWKLQYADVRMPLAKTPSDIRSNLNAASDMANRCF